MKKGILYIFLATILFSSMEIVLKIISTQFHPLQITLLRFVIGSVVLAPMAVKKLKLKGLSIEKSDLVYFMLTGFICVVVSMTFYQLAILYTKASIVAVIFSCNPVFVIPLAHYILKEKIYRTTIFSMLISLAGIISILNPFNISVSISGVTFAVLSAVAFALYGVVGKFKTAKYGSIVFTCFSFFMGSIELFLIIILSRIEFIANLLTNSSLKGFANIPLIAGIQLSNIPSIIYIGIFVTGLGYTFYFLAMEETSATTASIVFFIKPALAPVLALLIISETIAPNTLLGIVLIIIGSSITLISNYRKSIPKISSNKNGS